MIEGNPHTEPLTIGEKDRLSELAAILALKKVKGLGPAKFRQIFELEKSFMHVFDLSEAEMKERLGFRPEIAGGIKNVHEALSEKNASALLQQARAQNAQLVTFFDSNYPRNLFLSNASVPLLFVKGRTDLLKEDKCCAMVGTRSPSPWTIRETMRAVERIVDGGYTIVSGLAEGIDSVAHTAAISHKGFTIAVLGQGVDIAYSNRIIEVQDEVAKEGLLVSEYGFGTRPRMFSLKKRNKITVGLSKFVFIAETSTKGGTMNAYRAAVEQKKPVGVFLPTKKTGGDFSGNKLIVSEGKVPVATFSSADELKIPIDFHMPVRPRRDNMELRESYS